MKYTFITLGIFGVFMLATCFYMTQYTADRAVAAFNSKHNILIMPASDIKAVAKDIDAERAQQDFKRKIRPNAKR